MSIRNFEKLFRPHSVALIGASERPGSVGAVVARNLRRAGFEGELLLVDPNLTNLNGMTVYRDVARLPHPPDLAVIATPPDTVPGLVAELGARGTRAAVVITTGFGESGESGGALQRAVLEAGRPHLLRLIGPNCVGLIVPGIGLDASVSHLAPPEGDIAFVSQSGAMMTAMLDWAAPRGIGFSHVVSLGDMADVDFGDMLDWLATEQRTRAILLYAEGISHGRKFMSAARAAARLKPVLILKAGRSQAGARAAASHTGMLAGSDRVYDAAFRRAGMLRVATMAELFDAVETLALTGEQHGERLAILTNGGGAGVLATDALAAQCGRLAEFRPRRSRGWTGYCRRPGAAATRSTLSATRRERIMRPCSKRCSLTRASTPCWRSTARRRSRLRKRRRGPSSAQWRRCPPRRGEAATCLPPGSACTPRRQRAHCSMQPGYRPMKRPKTR